MKVYYFVCLLTVQNLIEIVEAASQGGIYSGIPLCCPETKIFDGSHCTPHREISPDNYPPVKYEEPKYRGRVSFIHSPLHRCSSAEQKFAKLTFHDKWTIGMTSNGSATLKINGENNTISGRYPEFCLVRLPSEKFGVLFCKPLVQPNGEVSTDESSKPSASANYLDCSNNNVCVSKCCHPGSYFSLSPPKFGCVPMINASSSLNLTFRAANGTSLEITKNLNFIIHFLLCKLYDFENLNLLPNGSLFLPTTGELIHKDQYCLDIFKKKGRRWKSLSK